MITRMTTPTTITTSMITTATTIMTDVVLAPSLGGLLVGCVLLLLSGTIVVVAVVPTVLVSCMPLLTKTVPAVPVAPSVLVGCMLLQIGAVLVVVITPTFRSGVLSAAVDTVERRHNIAQYSIPHGTEQRTVKIKSTSYIQTSVFRVLLSLSYHQSNFPNLQIQW